MLVAQGDTRDALVDGMLAKFDAGDDGSASYRNRPAKRKHSIDPLLKI